MLDADGGPVACASCPYRHDLYEAFKMRREQVRTLLGHESHDTTAKYQGLVKDDLKREYDRAVEAILAERQ